MKELSGSNKRLQRYCLRTGGQIKVVCTTIVKPIEATAGFKFMKVMQSLFIYAPLVYFMEHRRKYSFQAGANTLARNHKGGLSTNLGLCAFQI